MIRVCFKKIAKHYSNHWILCTQIYKHIPLPSPLSLSFSVFLFLSLFLSLSLFLPHTLCVSILFVCVCEEGGDDDADGNNVKRMNYDCVKSNIRRLNGRGGKNLNSWLNMHTGCSTFYSQFTVHSKYADYYYF